MLAEEAIETEAQLFSGLLFVVNDGISTYMSGKNIFAVTDNAG